MSYIVIAAFMPSADPKKVVHKGGERIDDKDIPGGIDFAPKYIREGFIATKEQYAQLDEKNKLAALEREKANKTGRFDPQLLSAAAEFIQSDEYKKSLEVKTKK